jgi:BASS family bile acid:Na+ symporter
MQFIFLESQILTQYLLPIALGIVMLGLGLTLTVADFKRVVQYPKAVMIGLACQMLILPAVCLGLCVGFAVPAPLAVGFMLLAASPGGATANLFSHLAHGDVALNITLTAVNSVLTVVTLPLIVNFSLGYFMAEDTTLPLQFDKIISVFAIVLVPVTLGMILKAKMPAVAQRAEKTVRIFSIVVLVVIIAGGIAKEWTTLQTYGSQVIPVALLFNLLSIGVGYFVPRLTGIRQRQAIAIGMEIGIHNGTLAIAIAMAPNLLNNSTMAMPAAVYSILMFFTAAAFGALLARKAKAEAGQEAA